MTLNKYISWGFALAGLANILGVSLFSMLLTNAYLSEISPTVMSRFGLVCIILWGFTYLAVAQHYQNLRWLILVFAIEKMVYVWSWWDVVHGPDFSLSAIYHRSVLTGLFYTVYGANDFISGLFFFFVFWRLMKMKISTTEMDGTSL
jgi:hypothetical protein